MAVPDEIPHGSVEFVTVVLESLDDLSTDVVKIGFTQDPNEQPIDWVDGVWPTPGENIARTAVPWDTTNVTLGFWAVWSWVVDSPESLPRRYGVVRIV